jgi:hypothetical protein
MKEATMSDPVGGIKDAAHQVHHAACQAGRGIGEVRHVIRAQPIAAALAVFTLGYLVGRLGSLIPSRNTSARRL